MNECVEGFFYVWSVCWIIEGREGGRKDGRDGMDG